MRRHTKSLLALTLALAVLPLTGCKRENRADYDDDVQRNYNIYVITKSTESYWDAVKVGALEAGEELGVTVHYDCPQWENEEGIQKQKDIINNAIASGADAIVLASIDSDALNDTLRLATQNGVQVLTIDSDVSYPGKASFVGTQNETASSIAARYAAELLGEEGGDVAVVAHMMGTPTQVTRTNGFVNTIDGEIPEVEQEVIETQPATDAEGNIIEGEFEEVVKEVSSGGGDAYPNINVIEIAQGEGDVEKSKQLAKELIENNPNLKLIYATNQSGNVGVCQAVEELGVQDTIQVVAFDAYDGAIGKINSGVLDGVIVQNPYNMGYLGVRYAVKCIENQTIAHVVDTGVTLVTKSNMNDEDVQWLLSDKSKEGDQ